MAIGTKIKAGRIKTGKPKTNTGKPDNSNFGIKRKPGKNVKPARKMGNKKLKPPTGLPSTGSGATKANPGKPDNSNFGIKRKPGKNIKPVRKMGNKKVKKVSNKGKMVLF
jgi:hypothetical protein